MTTITQYPKAAGARCRFVGTVVALVSFFQLFFIQLFFIFVPGVMGWEGEVCHFRLVIRGCGQLCEYGEICHVL